MPSVLMVSRDGRAAETLMLAFPRGEFNTSATPDPGALDALPMDKTPDVVLLDAVGFTRTEADETFELCRRLRLPVMALVTERELQDYDIARGADDFALKPPNPTELALRVTQLLRRLRGREGSETIHSDDLVIDQSRYEVTLSGHRVLLTFKEYELLRLLASNPGRVFSREELLSRGWGYEYLGGTPTVAVHLRPRRRQVEDANHT
ncbi:MAG: response regulator transcription factor, partial [Chloroflexota bacterium]|nr:response regulator transcription factor [Chloroflexota bacterium]